MEDRSLDSIICSEAVRETDDRDSPLARVLKEIKISFSVECCQYCVFLSSKSIEFSLSKYLLCAFILYLFQKNFVRFQNLVISCKLERCIRIDAVYFNRIDLQDASSHSQKINNIFYWFYCTLYLICRLCYRIFFFQYVAFATRLLYGTIFVRNISDAGISKINSLRVDQCLPRLLSVRPRLSYFSSFYETNGKIKKAKRICLGKQRRRLDGQDSRGKLRDRGQRRVPRRVCARVELVPVESLSVISILFHRIQKQNLFYLHFLSPRQRKAVCDRILPRYCNGGEIISMWIKSPSS